MGQIQCVVEVPAEKVDALDAKNQKTLSALFRRAAVRAFVEPGLFIIYIRMLVYL